MPQDTIEREITVKASKERVFKAITDPQEIVAWFPDAIEGNLDAGSSPIFDFGNHGKVQIYVEAVKPYDYFAYRWVPINADGSIGFLGDVRSQPNTLIEFRLEQVGSSTVVKLKESGFASLPPTVGTEAFGNNSGGWDHMLGRLEGYLGQ